MKEPLICTKACVAKSRNNSNLPVPIKLGFILDKKVVRTNETQCSIRDNSDVDVLLNNEAIKINFHRLTKDNLHLLLPITEPAKRYTFFISYIQNSDFIEIRDHAFVELAKASQVKCVVKYIGPVNGRDGTWFGIELLEQVHRGDNSGTIKKKFYFSCDTPNAGLFVSGERLIKIKDGQQFDGAAAGTSAMNPKAHDNNKKGNEPPGQSLKYDIGDVVKWPMEGQDGGIEIGEITSFSTSNAVIKRTGEVIEGIGDVTRDESLPDTAVVPLSKLILHTKGQKRPPAPKHNEELGLEYLIGKNATWREISCVIRDIVLEEYAPRLWFIVECDEEPSCYMEALKPQKPEKYGIPEHVLQIPKSGLDIFDETGVKLDKNQLSKIFEVFETKSNVTRTPLSVVPKKASLSLDGKELQGSKYFICMEFMSWRDSHSHRYVDVHQGALIRDRLIVNDASTHALVWDDEKFDAWIPRSALQLYTKEINEREFGILLAIKSKWDRINFYCERHMRKLCSEVLMDGMRVKVGSRLLLFNNKAIVRYIGEVEGKEGIWFGIEVHETNLTGARKGSMNNVTYFLCEKGNPRFVSADEIQEDSECPVRDQRRGEKVRWSIEENHFGIGIIEHIYWDNVRYKAAVKCIAEDLPDIGVVETIRDDQEVVDVPVTQLTRLEASHDSCSDDSVIGRRANWEVRTTQFKCTIKDVKLSHPGAVKVEEVEIIVECDDKVNKDFRVQNVDKYGKKHHVAVVPCRDLHVYDRLGLLIDDKTARRMLQADIRRKRKDPEPRAAVQEEGVKEVHGTLAAENPGKRNDTAGDQPVLVDKALEDLILDPRELMYQDLTQDNFPTLVNVEKGDVVVVQIGGLQLNGFLRWTGVLDRETACVGIEMMNHTNHGTNGSFNDMKLFECERGLGVLVRAHLVHPMDAFDEPAKAAPAEDVSRGQPAESVADENPPHDPMEVAEEAVETETEYQKFVNSLVASDIPTRFPDGGTIEIDCAIETEITSPKWEIRYGSVRWTGFGSDNMPVVGVELDGYVDHGTDGTFEGVFLFDCKPDRGLILPADRINRDRRFTRMVKAQEVAEDKIPAKYKEYTEAVKGATLPDHELDEGWLDSFRGIQGTKNSCYMDATLFAMFAFNSVLDGFLHKPLEDNGTTVQDILREEIVNPLRRKRYVSSKNIMKLREALQRISTVAGLLGEEKDPEEFLNALLRILRGDPLLEMSSGQTTYLYQLFLDDTKIDKQTSPNIQFLVEHSFHQIELKLKKIPHCFILQMPRHGKSYKMFERIVPNLTLDITYLLDDYPRACGSCKSKPDVARYECKTCFKEKGNMEQASFCDSCYADHKKKEKKHETIDLKLKDEMSGIKPCTETMELFAVVCIETSHYISFVKAAKDWVFFDSMWDRRGTFNVPQVEKIKDFEKWFVRNPPERLDEMQRRLFCDAYLCMYRNTNQANYG